MRAGLAAGGGRQARMRPLLLRPAFAMVDWSFFCPLLSMLLVLLQLVLLLLFLPIWVVAVVAQEMRGRTSGRSVRDVHRVVRHGGHGGGVSVVAAVVDVVDVAVEGAAAVKVVVVAPHWTDFIVAEERDGGESAATAEVVGDVQRRRTGEWEMSRLQALAHIYIMS